MANQKLRFFDKKGEPLNFEYVGPTASAPLDNKFYYRAEQGTTPSSGYLSISNYSNNQIVLNLIDSNSYNLTGWVDSVNDTILQGGKITFRISWYPAQVIEAQIVSASIAGSIVTLTFSKYVGPTQISTDTPLLCETFGIKLPGGYFKGTIYFEPVSAGLYENEQIFVVQDFIDSSSNDIFIGYPHAGSTGATGNPYWRSRWENNTYGSVDVTDIIFTYQIEENDPEIGGDPSIVNYQNIAFPVIQNLGDYYQNGYIVTPEAGTPSKALEINVGLNTTNVGAEIYERKLIVEDITTGTPEKIVEIEFYGQVIAEDERLDVLTKNLGRSFLLGDSVILRDHDSNEIFPDYIEINEKRKELMVAGEDIFPYIGSYKGLIGALKFFGYQDLRIKEYWLNLNYNRVTLTPLQQNQFFLDNYEKTIYPNQTILIADVLDNENTGKYRLEQTYGPNASGEYVLNVSGEDTLVPSRTYKKTALFGLYYDINRTTDQTDAYGYPVTEEAFAFTQQEVLLKLFALKERLKQSYLPLNARIVDITGEGVYYNIYNTKEWTDFLDRSDIDLGNNIEFIANPDFGFIEDLRALGVRTYPKSIQTPMNYGDSIEIDVTIVGPSGDAFRFSGYNSDNPILELERGKSYNFNLLTSGYDLYFTTDFYLSQIDPLGISNNGATGGIVQINVNPQEQNVIYYYSSVNTSKLNGSCQIIDAPVSDFGNVVPPLFNNQNYNSAQNSSMLEAIANFYTAKQNGELENLGDGVTDPISFIDPITGQPYVNPVGMPVILEYLPDRWVWDEMGQTWDSMNLPSFASQQASLTWQTIDFSAFNEIEWIVEKPQTQPGNGYYFSFRGFAVDFYKLAHFLPYTGTYNVTCYLYDAFNFQNSKILNSAITVEPRQILLDGWTRYRENEKYNWDFTIRSWDAYDSIWEYPAEGKTFDELTKQIPEEILEFATYGNNGIDGQSLQVLANIPAVGASGDFIINQNILDVSKAYSLLISGSQYGNLTIHTSVPNNFINGSQVFLSGFSDELDTAWQISIPSGATGYSFEIPYVLGLTAGVGATSGISSIAGGTAYYLLPSYYPNQKVTGGGSISVSINNRVIGATSSGSNLQATVNSIVQEVNSTFTQPDYFAQSLSPNSIPATVSIVADTSTGNIGNGDILSVSVSGSLVLVSSDSLLGGGVTGSTDYLNWNPLSDDFPVTSLKYYGTKNLTWDTFNESIWDEAYAHGWYDFEYQNGWLGGFEIHSIKGGDNIKVSTGNETFPFPTGVTFSGSSLTLGSAASQLNTSDDSHITNFYYRVIPATQTASLTTTGPVDTVFNSFPATGGSYNSPPTVPGAPPLLVVNFTYATGP